MERGSDRNCVGDEVLLPSEQLDHPFHRFAQQGGDHAVEGAAVRQVTGEAPVVGFVIEKLVGPIREWRGRGQVGVLYDATGEDRSVILDSLV